MDSPPRTERSCAIGLVTTCLLHEGLSSESRDLRLVLRGSFPLSPSPLQFGSLVSLALADGCE
eukprot:14512160-Heterocapsa_arctica.AAC.1